MPTRESILTLVRSGLSYPQIGERLGVPTSPMSVGSWILAGFAPLSGAAAASSVTGKLRPFGTAATYGAGALGPALATYTAALISNTAVPAWYEGHRELPFVFASSATAAACGLGLLAAAEVLNTAGAVGAVIARRSALLRRAAGAALLTGSAIARFGIFKAGVASAQDPKYTVVPQRERLEQAGAGALHPAGAGTHEP